LEEGFGDSFDVVDSDSDNPPFTPPSPNFYDRDYNSNFKGGPEYNRNQPQMGNNRRVNERKPANVPIGPNVPNKDMQRVRSLLDSGPAAAGEVSGDSKKIRINSNDIKSENGRKGSRAAVYDEYIRQLSNRQQWVEGVSGDGIGSDSESVQREKKDKISTIRDRVEREQMFDRNNWFQDNNNNGDSLLKSSFRKDENTRTEDVNLKTKKVMNVDDRNKRIGDVFEDGLDEGDSDEIDYVNIRNSLNKRR